jgi:NADH-quinone oxidoreductase subunit J
MEASHIATFFFYLFSALSVLAALAVVLEKRLLRAAVALVLVLACGAGFAILLGFELMAGVQILVFIGGIVVLLVYAIMMTSSDNQFERPPTLARKLWAAASASALFLLTIAALYASSFKLSNAPQPEDEVAAVGRQLLSNDAGGYIVAFELISLLLLAALIGSIVVAKRLKTRQEEPAA